MKVKTSITLSSSVLSRLDRALGQDETRSEIIEKAVLAFLEQMARTLRESRDLKILNKKARALNKEAEDTLSYQVDL
ncbi:MAG TPA: hypothetical protein DDW49_08765 [Deltaproteobacteria bacterium]|nr:MAG: hypothetical protein A2048_03220 [Deltaproteobacteria bacterium GWA2_45_12]HBF13455.1 hypothetical protein [Deltaproteobacteria bacterium]